MEIQIHNQPGFLIVEISGEIDGKTAGVVQDQLLPLVNAGNCMLVDMTKVGYMSSAGLRLLLTLYRQAAVKTAKLVLVGLSDDIRETMDATGFLSHFILAGSRPEGEAMFKA